MPAPTPHDIAWFDSPEELRDWLEANHETATERWIGMRPKAAGLPTVTWEQIVDEVLCVGWIDGVRYRTEGGSCIRITPRRAGSVWSARNIGRVEALRAEGRMRPGGEAAFGRRREDRSAIYAFERDGDARRGGGRGAPRGRRPRVLRGPVEELPAARGRVGRRREAARDAGQAARRGRGGQRRRAPGGRAQPQPAPRGLIAGVHAGSMPWRHGPSDPRWQEQRLPATDRQRDYAVRTARLPRPPGQGGRDRSRRPAHDPQSQSPCR